MQSGPCRRCAEAAVVVHQWHPNYRLCFTHAQDTICACGHTAVRCPIAGCGDWQPTSEDTGQLLMFEFELQCFPDRHRLQ